MPVGLDIERQLLLAQRACPIRSRFRANHLASAIECETHDNYSGRAFQLVTRSGRQQPIFFVWLVHLETADALRAVQNGQQKG